MCWPCPIGTPWESSQLCALPQTELLSSQRNSVLSPDYILVVPFHRRLLWANAFSCEPGLFFNQTVGACALCPLHHYCPLGVEPIRCPDFSIAPSPGATQCDCLPAFDESAPPRSGCELRQHRSSEAANAFTCPPELFRAMLPTGGPACFPCPQGTHMVNESCLLIAPYNDLLSSACGPGSYYFNDTTCELCPLGTFSPYIGFSPCTPCPPNTSTFAAASTHVAQCLSLYFST